MPKGDFSIPVIVPISRGHQGVPVRQGNPVVSSVDGFDAKTSEVVYRDEYSDTYRNSDGTFTRQFTALPSNVLSGGQWVPGTATLTKDAEGWSAKKNPFSSEVLLLCG